MKKLFALLSAAIAAFSMSITASAVTHYDPNIGHITYENAPEGTVYMDVLVKMDTEDQNFVTFTQPPTHGGEKMPITAESDIAKYNEDGYVSLSLHHKKAESFEINDEGDDLMTMHSTVQVSSDFIDLSINYGDFKAAYVDGEGKVLGVTDVSVTEYSRQTPYGFHADGSSLVFQRHGAHPAVISVTVFLTGLVIISLPIVAVFIYRKRSKRIKPSDLAGNARKHMK
ncbi:hypothetical protein [uncultured Ruminococcus sp.]|uniref:hypothetical protein n=1 Tax=uncultured Ruminococcus sp. TaxID=165186 RepID=UPI0025EAEA4B|nr:hypothetical protein [uncultured Ruminococcus sp.]